MNLKEATRTLLDYETPDAKIRRSKLSLIKALEALLHDTRKQNDIPLVKRARRKIQSRLDTLRKRSERMKGRLNP